MTVAAAAAAPPTDRREVARRAAEARRERRRVQRRIAWFGLLIAAICLEGLGRRYLRQLPPTVFYFFKDVVLVAGFAFGIDPTVKRVMKKLFGKAIVLFGIAVAWTFFEMFNPMQASFPLAFVGLRSYWLWWLAPLVIASTLIEPKARRGAVLMLAVISVMVCLFAVTQFGSPPEADINTYSVTPEGEPVPASAVGSTGRARVASTFSFITGFSDFTIIVPPLLLTIALGEADRRMRLIGFAGAAITAAVLPMSGSRAPLLIAGSLLGLIAWSAGFLFTPAGRRLVFGAVIAAVATLTAFPEALQGVYDRMAGDDTSNRLDEALSILPPVSLSRLDYPLFGIGTGMQHNARLQFFVASTGFESEYEAGKQLIELGVPGYLMYWLVRLGLSLALLRASSILRRAGRGAAAGAAIGFAALTFFGNLTFDHIWQSLFFVAVAYILAETTLAYQTLQSAASAAAAAAPPPPWTRRRPHVV